MGKMNKKEYEEGIKSQVNENDLIINIKRNRELKGRVEELERELRRMGDKEVHYLFEIDEIERDRDKKLDEYEKRVESYKWQLIVYKGIVERVMSKLLDK